MKRIISFTLSLVMVFGMITFIAPTVAEASDGNVFYVEAGAKNGNGSGTSPFGSIEEARDAIRVLKKSGSLPAGGVDVIIRDGEYNISTSLTFTAEDSGTEDSPIRYVAENPHGVKLNGAVKLNHDDFTDLTSADKSAIVGTAAASKISSIKRLDLKKYGATSELLGYIGGASSGENNLPKLYMNGTELTIARYPNDGYLNAGIETKDKTKSFNVSEDASARIKTWRTYENAAVFAYTSYNWATHYSRISSIDNSTSEVTVLHDAGYGYGEGSRYYFYNLFAELDTEGEYYIDSKNCVLYAYFPASAKSAELTTTFLNDSLITVSGAEHITFEGLDVSMTRSDTGIKVNSNNITLDGIKLYGIGGVGINANGYDITIKNCDISGTGEDAIRIYGGDRQTLKSSNNLIYNNYIHHWATSGLTYRPAVRADGVGITVSHNEMAYSQHFAILYYGNDHVFEYNHIHHVTTDSADASAIYAGRQWTYYGNVLRYNYFHDIGNETLRDAKAIYFDDGLSGQTVYGNVITNVYGQAMMMGGGRDNTIFNNIFIDIYDNKDSAVTAAFAVDSRSRMGAEDPDYWAGNTWDFGVQFEEVPYNTGIWAEKYPSLAKLKYKKNTFELDDLYAFFNPAFDIVKNNAMYVSGKGPKAMTMSFAGHTHGMAEEIASSCDFKGNTLVAKNLDDFVDAANGNFTLKTDAKVFTEIPGFYSIPFGDIGLVDKAEAKVMSFDDVKSGDWFYSAAEYAYQNGLMNGTSATMFSPMLKMSRAQLVTVLYRLDGQAMSPATVPFGDLTQDWYKAAVAWAYDNGIVNGTSATAFSPDGDLTREQTATILYRYCKYKGYDVSASTDISSFPDAGKVGSYATDAIKWACAEGLLTGKPSGNVTILDPLGSATRSEIATIFMRFCAKF